MKEINKFISPFIKSNFPLFYHEEGPDFIAFMEAYFEYLESTDNPLYKSRRLLEFRDIDKTLDSFVQHFINKYLVGIPETVILSTSAAQDRKRFLIKHVNDIYKSKGTERGFKLLFRLLFNEEIEIEIPGDNILRTSDAKWNQPAFLSISDVSNIASIVGMQIKGSVSGATAFVENLRTFMVQQRSINIVDISKVQGKFLRDEYIYNVAGDTFIDVSNAPRNLGVMESFSIVSGGVGFQIGDLVEVQANDKGEGGKAVVSATAAGNGAVSFAISDRGEGYKANDENTEITIEPVGPLKPNRISFSPDEGYDQYGSGFNLVAYPRFANGDLANTTIGDIKNHIAGIVSGANTAEEMFGTRLDIDAATSVEATAMLDITNDGAINSADLALWNDIGTTQASWNLSDGQYADALNFINKYYNITDVTNDVKPFIFTYSSTTINGGTGTGFVGFFDLVNTAANGVLLQVNAIANGTGYCANGSFTYNVENLSQLTVRNSYYYGNTHAAGLGGSEESLTGAASDELHGPTLYPGFGGTGASFGIGTISDTEDLLINRDIVGSNNEVGVAYLGLQLGAAQYNFPNFPAGNLIHGTISQYGDQSGFGVDANNAILSFQTMTVGQIQSLVDVNSGSGYEEDPAVKVDQVDVTVLQRARSTGVGFKGNSAIITANATVTGNSVTEVTTTASGLGYRQDDAVILKKDGKIEEISATVNLGDQGISPGKWLGNQGLLESINKLQDSYFYQEYSYNVKSLRTLDKYKEVAKKVIHPSGVALFGQLESKSIMDSESGPVYYDNQISST